MKTVACMLGMILSLPLWAGELASASPAANLAWALEQAWQRHPLAASMPAREAEARAGAELAGQLTPGPAAISIGNLNDRLDRNRGQNEWEAELALPLWLAGQKSARQTQAESRIEDVAARRAALRLQLAGQVREAWWDLAAARQTRDLARRRAETAAALESGVLRRFRAGDLSRIDANLAHTEMLTAQSELLEAETVLVQAEQSFQALTGVQPPLQLSEETPGEQREPGDEHPLLSAAAAASRAARSGIRVAEEARRAPPELSLRVVRERGGVDETYANSVGVKLKIPFSSGARVRQAASTAQAEADQADAEMRQAGIRVVLETGQARRKLQHAETQLALAETRRALTADNLGLTEKAFALGETDLAALLRARGAAYEAESLQNRQRTAKAAARSRLNQALGILP